MADVATSGPTGTTTDQKSKAAPTVKPERPDEENYKAELAKAEKDLRAAEDRMAGDTQIFLMGVGRHIACRLATWNRIIKIFIG